MSSIRTAAWRVLRSGALAPLRLVDAEAERSGFDARDRGLLRQLVGTEVRRRGTLRAMVRDLAVRQPKPELTTLLHLGLVQLFFLDRVPDHAAVSETVDAVRSTLGDSRAKLANAVLREAVRRRCPGRSGDPRRDLEGRDWHWREPLFHDPSEHPLLWAEDALSIPAALFKRWANRYGEERARELARTFLEEPPLSVRIVSGLGVERDAILGELAAAGLDPRPTSHRDVVLLPPDAVGSATASDAFRTGRITVQGESALRAAELVDAVEGERTLELCAAPGGKTIVLAGRGARVVAIDRNPKRLATLAENAERMRVADRIQPVCSDGAGALTDHPFDAVLIDAPCSNTAILGARPSARWRFGPKAQGELVLIQEKLLEQGAARVRPGGRLVWSTCSIEPEENALLVGRFLTRVSGWIEEERLASLPDREHGPSDGGFAVRLRRTRP